ncbi:MAG: hypothetical protein J6B31_04360 [Bacteroidaceae bacterium]|nr:hypothetical protein [Bacteroidaceae bacterium]
MKRRRRLIIPLLLLTLFVAYQVGITMFAHVHYVNGVMLVHSHPSSANHNHTEGQILTFAHVTHFVGTEPVFVATTELFLPVLYALNCHPRLIFYQSLHTRCVSLRAPPFLV